MKFFAMFRESAQELKSIRCLTTTGILSAIFIILNTYAPVFNETLSIRFGYLALATVGMLYGPVVAVIAAVPCDILVGTLSPFAMIPAFIPSRMLEAFIYGVFLYGYASRGAESDKSGAGWAAWQVMRIVIARFLAVALSYFIINSLIVLFLILPPGRAEQLLSEQSFFVWAFARTGLKSIAQFPVDLALMFTLLPAVNTAYRKASRGFYRERKQT